MRYLGHWLLMVFTMAGVNGLMASPPGREMEGLSHGIKRLGSAFVSIANSLIEKYK